MFEGTFKDRRHAGRELALTLKEFFENDDTIVLALPRGGVPVADEVAKALHLPLDVWIVRKLGTPGHEELAMGAISVGEVCYLDTDLIRDLGITVEEIKEEKKRETMELHRRNLLYRQGRVALDVADKTIIIVDDGLATGATMHAALFSLYQAGAGEIIVAVGVGSASACKKTEAIADKVICLLVPEFFSAVGQWYSDFSQTTDEEVIEILKDSLSE